MRRLFHAAAELLRATYTAWSEDNAARLSAALAYYAIFSLAPLLIIVIAVIDLVWGQQSAAAQAQVMTGLENVVGPNGTDVLRSMLKSRTVMSGSQSGIALAAGVTVLIVGATGVFAQLQDALNTLWHVRSDPDRFIGPLIRTRLLSFALILVMGLLVMLLLMVSALIEPLEPLLTKAVPGGLILVRLIAMGLSLLVLTLAFGIVLWQLPDTDVAWGDAWRGAAFTAVLFTLGKEAIGLYLGQASIASAYGAAGSVVVLLLWIYYSALIFLFGAAFTRVYATLRESAESDRAAAAPPSPTKPPAASSTSILPPRWRRRLGWIVLGFFLGRYFGSED